LTQSVTDEGDSFDRLLRYIYATHSLLGRSPWLRHLRCLLVFSLIDLCAVCQKVALRWGTNPTYVHTKGKVSLPCLNFCIDFAVRQNSALSWGTNLISAHAMCTALILPAFYIDCIRVGQNHICMVYIRYIWQVKHRIYGYIQCICTVLADPDC